MYQNFTQKQHKSLKKVATVKNTVEPTTKMGRRKWKLSTLFIVVSSIFVLNSCTNMDKADEPQKLPEYYILENFGNKIDYAILGVNGSGYFFEAQDGNPSIPKRLSIYNGNNIELVINFEKDGLPKNIVSENFSIVLGNFKENRFDAVVITKDGLIETFQNIETSIYWSEYKNDLLSGGFSLVISSMNVIATKGLWSDFGKSMVKVALLGATSVGCGMSLATVYSGISAALAFISCHSVAQQFGEITGLYELPPIIPEGLSTLGGALGTSFKCFQAGVGKDAYAFGECLQGMSELVLSLVDWHLNPKKDDIKLGEDILKSGSASLTITSPKYGATYKVGDWIDIFVSGYFGSDWQDYLELQYWCLLGEPQHTNNNEPNTYTNKAYPQKETNYSFTFSPETASVWEGRWVKLVAINKKNNMRSTPQYIKIVSPEVYEIAGVWKGWYRNGTATATLSIYDDMTGVLEFICNEGAGSFKVSVSLYNTYNYSLRDVYSVSLIEWVNRPSGVSSDWLYHWIAGEFKNGIFRNTDKYLGWVFPDFYFERVK